MVQDTAGRRRLILEKIRVLTKDRYGYDTLCLNKDGKFKTMTAHRLIAKAFIPNPENKPAINHKNGIKDDNRVENLEWCTGSENIQHAFDTGLKKNK